MVTTTTGLATSFITFTRTSNATVTDSDGRIKWAGHNLLTNSESFDASDWQKVNITLTANNIVAPNGTTTADKVAATASTGTAIYQNLSNAPSSFTYRLWVKKGSGATDANRFGVRNVTTSTNVLIVNVNYDTGAITYVTGSTGATMTDAGNGWWLLSLSVTSGVTEGNQITLYAGFDFNGETAGEFNYLWGAHLYRSDLGGMVLNPARGDAYYPTTPPNLLGYTEDFSNAAWNRSNISAFGSGSVANAAVAPNGLQTADLLVPDTTSAAHTIFQNSTVGGLNVQALYVKPAGYTKIGLRESQTGAYYAAFNLVGTGSVLDSSGATAAITALSDGWYRISMIGTISGTTRWSMYFLSPSYTSGSVISSWSGDGTSGIYLWGAQLSDSASLDAYSPVYGAAVTSAAYYAPRLDFDPVTLAARGLLVEEQRVNLLTYSAQFDDAAWVKTEATISANAAVAPDGLSTADKIIESTTASVQHFVRQGVTTTVQAYTFSAYVKAAGRTWCSLYTDGAAVGKYFDLTNGVVGNNSGGAPTSATITAVGSGWYRVAITFTSTAASVSNYIFTASANGTQAYTGDGTSGILVWGAQLEAGSFATSYIPTGASTATRTADVASVSTQAFPLGSTEGTIVTSATPIGFNTANFITTLQDASLNNFVQHYYQSATNLRVNVVASGGTVAEFDNAVVMGATHKVATAFKANDFASSFNGGSPQTDNTGTAPTGFTTLNIGRRSDGFTLNGHIRQITYIPRRLTNAELVARST